MSTALIPNLTPEETEILHSMLVTKQAPRGAVLLEMGKEDRDIYFITSGTCEIYQKFTITGKLFALRVASLDAPLMLGETNMLIGEKRSAAVVVSTDVTYSILPFAKVAELKANHPQIAIKLLEHIAAMIGRRFSEQQTNMRNKLLNSVDSPNMGISHLRRYIGDVHVCSPTLAQKLFNLEQPTYEDDAEKSA